MSFQDTGSALTHINRAAQNDWVALSPEIADVLAAALDFARRSNGLFDPCIAGRLVAAGRLPWHAGFPAEPEGDWRAVEFDGDRVRYAQPLLLDFSGIATGYAVDQALAELAADGVVAATVNAGGDLPRYGDSAITVHVRDPLEPTHILPVAELTQGAAATSADYFQPGHLVHPESGAPLCGNASVTVFAASCLVADALTKIVAADPAGAHGQLAAHGAQAIVFDAEGLRVCDTDGWHSLSQLPSSAFSTASHGCCPQPAILAN
jgi:thiamine biosynthesis lipoprotein